MMAFSHQLRALRTERRLTQKECSLVLAENRKELENVDYVSISRWEKGTVRPSLRKQVAIIRILGGDVTSLLEEAKLADGCNRSVEEWAEKKFDTINQMLAFRKGLSSYHQCNIVQATSSEEAKEVIDLIQKANEVLQLNECEHTDRYTNYFLHEFPSVSYCKDDQGIVGYSIDLKYAQHDLPVLLKGETPSCFPPTASNEEKDLILYSYVRMFAHSNAFKQLTRHFIRAIIKTPNIQKIVIRVMDQELYKLLSEIGFEVLTAYNNSPVSLIEIGSIKYSTVILGISTEAFLSDIHIREFTEFN